MLVNELLKIEKDEQELDYRQKKLDSEMIQLQIDPVYNQFAYVSYSDLEKLQEANSRRSSGTEKGINTKQSSTLIAIRAPPGSVLDVTNYQNIEKLKQRAQEEEASAEEIEALQEYLKQKFHIMIQSDPPENKLEDSHDSERMFVDYQGKQPALHSGIDRQIQVFEIVKESREVRRRLEKGEVAEE